MKQVFTAKIKSEATLKQINLLQAVSLAHRDAAKYAVPKKKERPAWLKKIASDTGNHANKTRSFGSKISSLVPRLERLGTCERATKNF